MPCYPLDGVVPALHPPCSSGNPFLFQIVLHKACVVIECPAPITVTPFSGPHGFWRTHKETLTSSQKSLLLSILTIVLVAQAPLPGYTEESSIRSDQALIPELQLMKEEETVSIASRYEQPISQSPSNVYVITDEDIRHSGATDIPTILRRIPGIEVM